MTHRLRLAAAALAAGAAAYAELQGLGRTYGATRDERRSCSRERPERGPTCPGVASTSRSVTGSWTARPTSTPPSASPISSRTGIWSCTPGSTSRRSERAALRRRDRLELGVHPRGACQVAGRGSSSAAGSGLSPGGSNRSIPRSSSPPTSSWAGRCCTAWSDAPNARPATRLLRSSPHSAEGHASGGEWTLRRRRLPPPLFGCPRCAAGQCGWPAFRAGIAR